MHRRRVLPPYAGWSTQMQTKIQYIVWYNVRSPARPHRGRDSPDLVATAVGTSRTLLFNTDVSDYPLQARLGLFWHRRGRSDLYYSLCSLRVTVCPGNRRTFDVRVSLFNFEVSVAFGSGLVDEKQPADGADCCFPISRTSAVATTKNAPL